MTHYSNDNEELEAKRFIRKWGTPQPILIGTPRFGMAFVQGFGDYSYTIIQTDENNKNSRPNLDEHVKTILLGALQESLAKFSRTRSALEVMGNTRMVAKETLEIARQDCNQIGVSLEDFLIGHLGLSSRIDEESSAILEKAEKDFKESQIISWARIKDFIVTLGAASGILAGVLWMGGRFYAYGYFERMNIPLYFLSFSVGEYAETYVTSIAANIITYVLTNLLQIFIIIVLVIAIALVLGVIQKRYKKLKIQEAVIHIDWISRRFLVISFVVLLFLSFFLAYHNGSVAANHVLVNGQTVTVYSKELLPLGISPVTTIPSQSSSLYAFTDLYLLTYNNGKYYFFTELDLVTCKPKQVYVIPDSNMISVNINESSLAFPKCAISPVK